MTSWLYVLIAAGVVIAAIWFAIRAATQSAKDAGGAEQRAGDQADARRVEQEMAEAQGEVITMPELRDRIRQGTFGGQDP